MNYMPKVLEMLGVGVGEKFNIKDVLNNNPFSFNDEFRLVGNYGHEETILLKLILNGEIFYNHNANKLNHYLKVIL